jgi:hypothetical protein
MKKTVVCIIIIVLIAGCSRMGLDGNGAITTTERMAEGFNGILLEGAGNINIHFSEYYKVMVTTDSNIQDIITIEVKNSLLCIDERRENGGINPTKIEIDVYLPKLESITVKGAGNIEIDNGKDSILTLTHSGAGDINAQNYEVENVNITLSGAGNIKTWVTNILSGDIRGVGNIYYKGNPTINVNVSGIGGVKKM